LPGADVFLADEGERDAVRDRRTEWSQIALGGGCGRLLFPPGAAVVGL